VGAAYNRERVGANMPAPTSLLAFNLETASMTEETLAAPDNRPSSQPGLAPDIAISAAAGTSRHFVDTKIHLHC